MNPASTIAATPTLRHAHVRPAMRLAASATRNDSPYTPTTPASQRTPGTEPWVVPIAPHEKPPTGHLSRTSSIPVHAPAIISGASNELRTSQPTRVAALMYSAIAIVSAVHAIQPN